MTCIADTGFLVALVFENDRHHVSVVEVARRLREPVLLPNVALTEIAYLIQREQGIGATVSFLERLKTLGMQIECPDRSDYTRAAEIMSGYADVGLDFVDTVIVAMAERLKIRKVLAVDRRHFGLIRPRHCPYFEILP